MWEQFSSALIRSSQGLLIMVLLLGIMVVILKIIEKIKKLK